MLTNMKKVKIGIIGTGVGIRTHLNGFKPLENADVVAICGSSALRSQEFANKHGIPIACADYKELCDLAEVDLVCVTSPNRFHFDAVKYAISKEKHIICEKPLSDDSKEVSMLVNALRNHSKIAVVDHQLRYNPYIRKIKSIIVSGELGEVKSIRLHQTGSGFVNADAPWSWSFDGAKGGGVRLAMASHFTDLIQFWFGERKIINVNGYLNPVTLQRKDNEGKNRQITASTACTAHINLENELNIIYSINAGSYIGSRFDISIFGTKGEILFTLQDKLSFYAREKTGQRQDIIVDGVFSDEAENKVSIFSGSFRYFAPLIIQAIQTDNYSIVADSATFFDAQYNLKILDAIQQSANCGTGLVFGNETNQYV
jgi:predicted dehydrogenase